MSEKAHQMAEVFFLVPFSFLAIADFRSMFSSNGLASSYKGQIYISKMHHFKPRENSSTFLAITKVSNQIKCDDTVM